jgi:hypothetical protein
VNVRAPRADTRTGSAAGAARVHAHATVRQSSKWIAAGLLLAVAAGCTRQNTVVLHQPFAPPPQQRLVLRSSWLFSAIQDERSRYLLAFPLPGATSGPRDFLLYLTLPNGPGTYCVAADGDDAARGFLVQAVGRLKGKTEFVGGQVRVDDVWLASGQRQIELDVHCADGTHITGQTRVRAADGELRAFERRYAADIAQLERARTPAEHDRHETAARSAGAP